MDSKFVREAIETAILRFEILAADRNNGAADPSVGAAELRNTLAAPALLIDYKSMYETAELLRSRNYETIKRMQAERDVAPAQSEAKPVAIGEALAFLRECVGLSGGMVNGNRLSIMASNVLALFSAQPSDTPSAAPAGDGGGKLTYDEAVQKLTTAYGEGFRASRDFLAACHAPTGADALTGWDFMHLSEDGWTVVMPDGGYATVKPDSGRIADRILAQLAALLAKRGQ